MNKPIDNKSKMEATVEQILSENDKITAMREQLKQLLSKQVAENAIDERDASLLLLRLGLASDKCHTLVEISQITDISPEYLRQRQHLVLQKKIRDPRFFQLLEKYSHLVKLPRGISDYFAHIQ